MFKRTKTFLLMLFLAGSSLGASGCGAIIAGAAAGAGTAYWLTNKLTDEVSASYPRMINAAKTALASLDMPLVKETRTDEVTQLISEYQAEKKVWIDIRPLAQNRTKIEIRVGIEGDKEASGIILEKIKQYI